VGSVDKYRDASEPVQLFVNFFAKREEKQILRCAQDDMSFRVKRSGARNLLWFAGRQAAM
jgi:hypothetical protein